MQIFSNKKVFLNTLGIWKLKNISKDNVLINAYIPNFEYNENIEEEYHNFPIKDNKENEKKISTLTL